MKASEAKWTLNRGRDGDRPAAGESAVCGRSGLTLALLAFAVVAATVWVHRPVLTAQATSFDDEEAVIRNRLVQNPSWHSVGRFFSEVTLSSVVRGYYRPLTLTSLMLDWAMGARTDDLHVFHRTSLVLHVGSTVLLILLCYQVFGRPVVAALVGLLFGLHPLTVEPIAWVMERKTILAAVFAFACLNAYVRYTRFGRPGWYLAAVVLYLLSLLAKPTGTPLPLMLLLMDYWPLGRFSRRAVIEKIPFFVLAAGFAVLCVVCEQRVQPLSLGAHLSPLGLALRLCWLIVFYPCKILLPIHLSSAYMLPQPLALTNPIVMAAAAGAALMAAAVVLSARRTPAVWTGTLMFYIGLAPTMGFVGYSWVSASDKYVYLPAVGLVLMLAWALERITTVGSEQMRRTRHTIAVAAVLVIATLLGVGTRGYLRQWQTRTQRDFYMLRLTPDSPYVLNECGVDLITKGEYPPAIQYLTRAIELKPDHAWAYYNRGIALGETGDFAREIQDCNRAIELNPDFAAAYNNRGRAYNSLGDPQRALRDCTKAIELRPDNVDAYYNRSVAFGAMGDFARQIQDCTKVIELKPDSVDAYYHRGIAYGQMGDFARAIQDYGKAIELKPGYAEAYNNRGNAYLKTNDPRRSILDYTKAIELKPDYADACHNRATAHLLLKEYDNAWADVKMCRRLGGTPSPNLLHALKEATGRSE